jgi:hypothetical protein
MIDPDSVSNKAIVKLRDDGKPLSRSDTKLIIQGVLNKWITAQSKNADLIIETLQQVMSDPKSRQRVDAAKALAAMAGDSARVLEVVDKIERLDNDQPTENMGIQIIFEEAKDPD